MAKAVGETARCYITHGLRAGGATDIVSKGVAYLVLESKGQWQSVTVGLIAQETKSVVVPSYLCRHYPRHYLTIIAACSWVCAFIAYVFLYGPLPSSEPPSTVTATGFSTLGRSPLRGRGSSLYQRSRDSTSHSGDGSGRSCPALPQRSGLDRGRTTRQSDA